MTDAANGYESIMPSAVRTDLGKFRQVLDFPLVVLPDSVMIHVLWGDNTKKWAPNSLRCPYGGSKSPSSAHCFSCVSGLFEGVCFRLRLIATLFSTLSVASLQGADRSLTGWIFDVLF